nr:hypothetical protein [Paraburkholderia monticola]
MPPAQLLETGLTRQILLYNFQLELLAVFAHEKTPKAWTGVQLLGFISQGRRFFLPLMRRPAHRFAARKKKGAANGTFLYYRQLLLKLRSGDADRP